MPCPDHDPLVESSPEEISPSPTEGFERSPAGEFQAAADEIFPAGVDDAGVAGLVANLLDVVEDDSGPSFLLCSNPPETQSNNSYDDSPCSYDVSDAIERAGWGWYQHKVLLVMGLMSFVDCAQITLATIIKKDLKCQWDLIVESVVGSWVWNFTFDLLMWLGTL
eukprot:sb/3472573/